ncbi:AAA domain-containing protein [Portibacter lacus]|uniref:DNA helicase n=1 Tax=Portibacter lacus TaxID=1099794 RepID=A0AA37SNR3_9BACT|nr:AAA domain-containing protein [Portibacter lacus]GLR16642.1 DNA helicase [Portibacter lacus]
MDRSLVDEILHKLHNLLESEVSLYSRLRGVHLMIDLYIEDKLKDEQIHFTTFFTKIAYVTLKFKLSKRLSYFLHKHRKNIELTSEENASLIQLDVAVFCLTQMLYEIDQEKIDLEYYTYPNLPKYTFSSPSRSVSYLKSARVHIFDYHKEEAILKGFNEDLPEAEISILLNVTGVNDDYNSVLRFLDRRKKFPVILKLEQIEIDEKGNYTPAIIVFEPDYLVDITTVAECFKPNESNPLFYFIKKFIPVLQNKYLIIGNIANYFLDELFDNPEVSFSELLKDTFKISPLGFSMMNDHELQEVVNTLKIHYHTIRDVVTNQLSIHSIDLKNTYLEPSFYSPDYGFQGRLDLFSYMEKTKEAKIIELKSGKPYRSNSYGLNINHYVQTLLYDLMVNAVTNGKLKISSFILYSSQASDSLRFAPPLKLQQKEAIKLRNQLVEIDYLLADVELDNDHLFSYIQANYIKSDGFAKRDIELFQKAYEQSSKLVRKYFNAYTAFIAREQILAKTGEFGLDKSSGLAGLWLDDMQEKIDNFQVLNALKIDQLKVEKDHTVITFIRTPHTAVNANFRQGDLGVVYPYNAGNESTLRNQIFKGSIISIDPAFVKVRLRNKQNNTYIFDSEEIWHIEHDHLDHGFNSMYQDLFRFINTTKEYQNRILGKVPPRDPSEITTINSDYMTSEQIDILSYMVAAKDYYLLWGPPGTGKTSVMLYEYLKHIYFETKETVLVLAYTNRAVDEICESISRIGGEIKNEYFRIGSRYSSNEKFVDDLLVTKLEDITNRFDLLTMLKKSRIIVSTLASIHGKKELFSLMKIDTIIVDEASQILEPQLIGFLSLAKKFILIGDHYQLPAIVRQSEIESAVKDEELNEIGLSDLSNSLFERIYKKCERENWTWALGKLGQQGRMHSDIMSFANRYFYKGGLSIIPSRLDLNDVKTNDIIFGERLVYIPTEIDSDAITYKTNKDEAEKTSTILKQILNHYQKLGVPVSEDAIGVITPYRAQISAIKSQLLADGITQDINIDTVERYQGGARDIIVISLCLNAESQLRQLVNLSDDGIDRKLNVAITRARKQIIILGNEEIMRKNILYSALIDACSLRVFEENVV